MKEDKRQQVTGHRLRHQCPHVIKASQALPSLTFARPRIYLFSRAYRGMLIARKRRNRKSPPPGGQLGLAMEYIRSLSPVAKERYVAKLAMMGLAEREDPYSNTSRFIDDMTSWPPVEYGHIYGYFIQRTAATTVEKLGSLKLF